MNYIGLNGEVVPVAKAMVSVMDHGFLYGMGLFETFRTYGGQPFLLAQHLDRLRFGCRAAGIAAHIDERQAAVHIAELLAANGLADAYIRYTVTAGEAEFGLPSADYTTPTVVVYVKPLPLQPAALYTDGKALRILKTMRNTPEGAVRLKSLHYMNSILGKRELSAYPPDSKGLPYEGLMLTKEGFLAEGIVSNLFFVDQNELYTPEVATGILPGITRQAVIDLAHAMGIAVNEGRFGVKRLLAADEIFLTGSVQEIVPVTRVYPGSEGEPITVGGGSVGPLTAKLQKAYREQTGGA